MIPVTESRGGKSGYHMIGKMTDASVASWIELAETARAGHHGQRGILFAH
jgi:hypothetical protein